MSDQLLRTILGGVLLLHGLGHGGAIGALAWIARFGPGKTGGWKPARSRLLPALGRPTVTVVASVFWAVALVGFVATALAFWGVGLPVDGWRALALVSAVVSMGGIGLFFGTWPMFNTVAALAVNVAVLVSILLGWPPESLFAQ